MQEKNKRSLSGFTLIELLVVVLIIGILAAIALPKYELAVEKSRLTEAMAMSKSLQQALDIWVLENGLPATNTYISFLGNESNGNGKLTIDLSNLDCSEDRCSSKNFWYSAWCSFDICCIIAARNGDNATYGVQWDKSISENWHGADCSYSSDDAIGEKICKGLVAQNNGFFLCPDC